MKAVICLDNHNGISFFHKRLSSDFLQREDMMKLVNNKMVTMSAYSAKLFNKDYNNIIIGEPHRDLIYFFEDGSINNYLDEIDELILYYWNKDYPYDEIFIFDESKFELLKEYEFKGNSHDKISCKIYHKLL